MKVSGLIIVMIMAFSFSLIAFGNLPKFNVESKKCIGCTLCVNTCPTKAIKMTGGKAVIDTAKCIGCGICADGDKKKYPGCPTKAIAKEHLTKSEDLSVKSKPADSLKTVSEPSIKEVIKSEKPAVNEK